MVKWTKEEEAFLLQNSEKPLKEVAEKLQRPLQSIKDKRMALGLKRAKINNLKGKRFGRLLVIKENGKIGRRVGWLCKCDCGTEKTISSTHLIQGVTSSCGCYNREQSSISNSKNLVGKSFNHLTVIKEVGRTINLMIKWLCGCDCGRKTIVQTNNLTSGNTESCGCRRKINQKKGLKWEQLINTFINYKFNDVIYHKRLPNNTIPDFFVQKNELILDTKRHDYLTIEECFKKYSPYSKHVIFICMVKKRKSWKNDFIDNNKIEFWYPEDCLSWIPEERHEEFMNQLKDIENLWINKENQKKILDFENTIDQLTSEGKKITNQTIAKNLGISCKTLRKHSNLSNYLDIYNQNKKNSEEEGMIKDLQKITDEKLKNCNRLAIQDIARTLIKSKNDTKKEITTQQVWALAKKLSTNRTYKIFIENESKKLEVIKKRKITKAIIELKVNRENITIQKIRRITGLPKNYLYSEQIAKYIKTNKQTR